MGVFRPSDTEKRSVLCPWLRLPPALSVPASLYGADLTGADLTGAVLSGATYNAKTRWPVGFEPPVATA